MGGSSSKTMSGQPFTIAAQARHTATVRNVLLKISEM